VRKGVGISHRELKAFPLRSRTVILTLPESHIEN